MSDSTSKKFCTGSYSTVGLQEDKQTVQCLICGGIFKATEIQENKIGKIPIHVVSEDSKPLESINRILIRIRRARAWLLEHVKDYAFTRGWHPYNDVRWDELAELCAAYNTHCSAEHTDSEELKEARRLISEYIDTINSFDAMGSVAARDRLRAFMKGKPVRNHRAEELERECEKLKKMVITARGMFKILNYLQNHRYQSIDEFIAETENITLKDSSEQCQCWNYMSDGCDLHGNKSPVQQSSAKDELHNIATRMRGVGESFMTANPATNHPDSLARARFMDFAKELDVLADKYKDWFESMQTMDESVSDITVPILVKAIRRYMSSVLPWTTVAITAKPGEHEEMLAAQRDLLVLLKKAGKESHGA